MTSLTQVSGKLAWRASGSSESFRARGRRGGEALIHIDRGGALLLCSTLREAAVFFCSYSICDCVSCLSAKKKFLGRAGGKKSFCSARRKVNNFYWMAFADFATPSEASQGGYDNDDVVKSLHQVRDRGRRRVQLKFHLRD